jgi:hypothetical protein
MGRNWPFLILDLYQAGDGRSTPGDHHFPFSLEQLIKM